jgi:ribose-phosphate pyrophosphokinase
MSSDAGGFKPLMKLCDKISWQGETASASKYRECKDGKSILTQLIAHNDFQGKDILIVDDICVYGGTFKGLSKILKERNCGKLYLAVSHMTVQNLGEDPVTNYFDKVFTTNSKYDQYFTSYGAEDQPKLQNLEIIKLF